MEQLVTSPGPLQPAAPQQAERDWHVICPTAFLSTVLEERNTSRRVNAVIAKLIFFISLSPVKLEVCPVPGSCSAMHQWTPKERVAMPPARLFESKAVM